MMEYGEKVTADPSTFDDPQYMFLRERLKALQDGWEEVHKMWENRYYPKESCPAKGLNNCGNCSKGRFISI